MATYQYRYSGLLDWASSSGSGIVVIQNPTGSGKKLTVRSFELNNQTAWGTTTSAQTENFVSVQRVSGAAIGGFNVPVSKLDTQAAELPSSIRITSQSSFASTSEVPVRRTMVARALDLVNLPLTRPLVGSQLSGLLNSPWRSEVEEQTIRAGESFVVFCTRLGRAQPMRVSGRVQVVSTGRVYTFNYYTSVNSASSAVFALTNDTGSGLVVKLLDLAYTEIGVSDTPYFQIVPLGPIDNTSASDTGKQITSLLKMDSQYPDPISNGWIKVYKDAIISPFGMPEDAINPGSAGTPKFFNYLKTKDFIGPAYRASFPEHIGLSSISSLTEGLAYSISHKLVDQNVRNGGYIVLNEGEGVALVSSAETATGTFVGLSGWQTWEVAFTVDIDPKIVPTLTITGLQNPSEVRIFKAGTTTEVAGQETVTTGSFSWEFDPTVDPSVDISILSLGYQNIRLSSFGLTLADVTIPVQQQLDRQYQNL